MKDHISEDALLLFNIKIGMCGSKCDETKDDEKVESKESSSAVLKIPIFLMW